MRTLIGSLIALSTLTLLASNAYAAEPGVGPVADDVPTDTGTDEAEAPSTRSAKNSLYIELLGNGGLYSLNYERNLTDDVAARVGFSYISLSASAGDDSANVTFMSFPLMANYLLGGGNHHLELGAGATVLYASGEAETGGSRSSGEGVGVAGTATVGYRYQPRDGGFLFKVGFTPLVGSGGFLPWGGISFGGVM
ncbi:MAG: hypothetical protein AB7S68_05310 [Polyangiaceae bacterium]